MFSFKKKNKYKDSFVILCDYDNGIGVGFGGSSLAWVGVFPRALFYTLFCGISVSGIVCHVILLCKYMYPKNKYGDETIMTELIFVYRVFTQNTTKLSQTNISCFEYTYYPWFVFMESLLCFTAPSTYLHDANRIV